MSTWPTAAKPYTMSLPIDSYIRSPEKEGPRSNIMHDMCSTPILYVLGVSHHLTTDSGTDKQPDVSFLA